MKKRREESTFFSSRRVVPRRVVVFSVFRKKMGSWCSLEIMMVLSIKAWCLNLENCKKGALCMFLKGSVESWYESCELETRRV